MSKSPFAGRAESLNCNGSVLGGIDCSAILPFERVPPDQYPSFVRQNDATLSFPEKLMMMLMHIEHMCIIAGRNPQDEAIHWTKSGDAFVIRDEKRLSSVWLRVFFGTTMYSSFTRKMYRWSFHKISPAVYQYDRGEVTIFGSINFHRDKKHLVLQMESQTAAKQRRSQVAQERKLEYQQFSQSKGNSSSKNAVTCSKLDQDASASVTVVSGSSQEVASSRRNSPSFPAQNSTGRDTRGATLDRLHDGLVLANYLREGGCHTSISSLKRLIEQDAALDTNLSARLALVQNQPSLIMLLLEERVRQQKERIQMQQALASIIRNRFAQE